MEIQCVVDAKAETGESPIWCPAEEVLYWVDIPAARLHRFDPSSGANQSFAMPAPIGCVALRRAGGLLVALQTGLFDFEPASGRLQRLAAPPYDPARARFNDGRRDRQGRFWVSDMSEPPEAAPAGRLHRYADDRHPTAMVAGLHTGNGLAFSPDGRTLYHSDSHPSVQAIWAWDLDPADGSITNRRLFASTQGIAGRPDGAAVDADGCYWVAANDGWQLLRYTPQGAIDRTIRLPVRRPTMLAFGGRKLDTIFVTSMRPRPGDPPADQPLAGGVLALAVGVVGLPEPRAMGPTAGA